MLLSGYNKFIFSIFSENHEYLILSIYIVKIGGRFISFLKIHYIKTSSSGKLLPSYVFNTRLDVTDFSDWDIIFSLGKIIFKEDEIKIEFSSNLLMAYLNFTWNQSGTSPKEELGKDPVGNNILQWNSFNFKSLVKGHFITPYSTTEFKYALGNIEMVKAGKFPAMVKGLLWSRLHHKEIDLTFSLIFNNSKKNDTNLQLLHNNKIIEFSDIDYDITKEKISSQKSVLYPDRMNLHAKNEDYEIALNIHDNFEVIDKDMAGIGFIDRINDAYSLRQIGNPKGLRLLSKADIIIKNNLTSIKMDGVTSISEYVCFSK